MLSSEDAAMGGRGLECVDELLNRYARQWPEKAAIVDLSQGKRIGYGDLQRLVEQTARHLSALGVTKDDRVLLLANETLEKLVLWLAVWRLSAIVCPLNIEMNERHLLELSVACEPKLVLLDGNLPLERLLEPLAPLLVRYSEWAPGNDTLLDTEGVAFSGVDLAACDYRGADISCIFCTSGTTDKPKLIVYDHDCHWIGGLAMIDALQLTADDRTLEYRSFGWASVQVLSLMPFLQLGLSMHIAERFSKSKFFAWISDNGITFSVGVPTVVAILLEEQFIKESSAASTLRLMSCSTAPLSAEQWRRFEETYPMKLIQMYGMSEANWICANRPQDRLIGTVGKPVYRQVVDFLDADGQICPDGIEGEVTVSGPQVAVGYLAYDGSVTPIRGSGLKTGDLGFRDDNGFVHITGRTKDLIIRGGINISPVEIDSVLLSHPDVREAASVGVPHPIYGEEVVCFVASKKDHIVDAQSVMAHCASELPAAKVPKEVLVIDTLPRNDRGKVLRQELRDMWQKMHGEQRV